MAVLALSTSLRDLRRRMGRIVVGYTAAGEPVTAEQLKAAGAMTVIMRDAIKPNLLQTLENTPVLVHAGPFGNIAHGNSSVVADLIGIHAGEFLVTEAGFGADMGAERFFNIKCRTSGLVPDAAVVVTTVRAMKLHSGRHRVVAGRPLPPAMLEENPEEVELGAANLLAHLAIVRRHGVTPVVAINAMDGDFAFRARRHPGDRRLGGRAGRGVHALRGRRQGSGGAGRGRRRGDRRAGRFPHALRRRRDVAGEDRDGGDRGLRGRRGRLPAGGGPPARHLRAGGLRLAPRLHRQDPPLHLLGPLAPWVRPGAGACRVREARANVGAGFVYLVSGDMRTMPGLSSSPAAERIDIDENGNVVGLY